MIKPMYRGKPFSPQTFLKESIGAGDTQMSVVDPSILPNEPNYLTIWEKSEDKYEVVSYTGINNDIVLGLKRGVEGTPQEFTTDAIVFRTFTNSDYGTLIDNIETLEAEKQPVGEYATNTDVTAKIAEHDESLMAHSEIMDTKVNTDWSNASDFKLTPTNIAMGQGAMSSMTTGVDNIAIGTDALKSDSIGDRNIAIGKFALSNLSEEITLVEGSQNIAIGHETLLNLKKGRSNFAIGSTAMRHVTEGDYNIAIGISASSFLKNNPIGTITIGRNAGLNGAGNNSIAIGEDAMKGISGNIADKYSVAIGKKALGKSLGEHNIAIGYEAIANGSTCTNNIALGRGALQNSSSYGNIAIGLLSQNANQNANSNISIGNNSLSSNQIGSNAISIGAWSQNLATVGNNLSIGNFSLASNKTGSANVAIGYNSLSGGVNIKNNVAVGYSALELTNANSNVAVGMGSSHANTDGTENTAIGHNSFSSNKTGSKNTSIGANSLIFTYSGVTFNFSNCTGLGSETRASANNQVQLGDTQTTTYAYGAVQNRSDIRDKADVQDTKLGLDFIQKLRPVDFRWDYRDDYFKQVHVIELQLDKDGYPEETLVERLMKIPKDGSKKRNRLHHGLIAQEVKATLDTMGVDFGGYQDHSINGGCDVKSIGYEELISPMIKAIQELKSQVDDLTKQIAELKEVNKLL